MTGFAYIWFWRKYLPERKGSACRLICRGCANSIMVEFEDGFQVVTSGWAIRKRKENHG
jgi:hypothetical protein